MRRPWDETARFCPFLKNIRHAAPTGRPGTWSGMSVVDDTGPISRHEPASGPVSANLYIENMLRTINP